MATRSCPILRAGPRRSGRPSIAWLFLITLASIAIVVPSPSVSAAEDDERWEANVVVQKWLDRDGDLTTDDDRGSARDGWTFDLSIVGSADGPVRITTDSEGWAEAYMEVPTRTADIRVTEASSQADLIGVYADTDEDWFELPITDRGVTITLDRETASMWSLGFVNQGAPVIGVTAWVQSMIDADGDPETADWVPGANWVYDVEVSGTATVRPARVQTGRQGDGVELWIERTEPTTTLRITQRARDGYDLLDAFATSDARTLGSVEGRTFTVTVDSTVTELTIDFINHKLVGPRPTPVPTPSAQAATTPTPSASASRMSTPSASASATAAPSPSTRPSATETGVTGVPGGTTPPTIPPFLLLVVMALGGLTAVAIVTVRSNQRAG